MVTSRKNEREKIFITTDTGYFKNGKPGQHLKSKELSPRRESVLSEMRAVLLLCAPTPGENQTQAI